MHIPKKIKKNQGFTLIELLLSMAIVAFLSAIMFQMARQSDTSNSLMVSRDRFKSTVRAAQSFALTGSKGDISEAHVCGFGVVVTGSNSYELFYNPADETTDCEDTNYQKYSSISKVLKTYTFTTEKGTKFDAADVTGQESVFFKLPYGDVYDKNGTKLVGASSYVSPVGFEIEKDDGSNSTTIEISPFGRVE